MSDPLREAGIAMILFLQGLGDWWQGPMQLFSRLGDEEFFLLVMPVIYWCVDAAWGVRAGILLLLSNGLHGALKLLFHTPRPFWYDSRVQVFRPETSFGLPSGHAQNAMAVWGGLAAGIHRGWAWALAIPLIFLIGLSRLFLGLHFPSDVLAGWLTGALLLWLVLRLERPILAWLWRISLPARILAALGLSLGLILPGVLARAALATWQFPPLWLENLLVAYPEVDPNLGAIGPLALSGIFSAAGALFGLAAGAILLWEWGGFEAGGPLLQRALRFLIGVVGVFVFWQGLGAVLPRGEYLLAYVLRWLRYALTGFWIAFLAPWLFLRLRIAVSNQRLGIEDQKGGNADEHYRYHAR